MLEPWGKWLLYFAKISFNQCWVRNTTEQAGPELINCGLLIQWDEIGPGTLGVALGNYTAENRRKHGL